MQPYNRIYYSRIYWMLNMFRAAYRSSSGAPNCICSLWFIYTCGDRLLSRLGGNCNLLKTQHVSSGIPLIIRSSKLYLLPLVYIPAVPTQPGQRPVTTLVYKTEAANAVWCSWWWAVCRSKHIEPSINFVIINSITRLHLVGNFYCFILRCTDPWILNLSFFIRS